MEFKTEIKTADNGASVEVATVLFRGQAFTALGSCVDEERGIIRGYICGIAGAYTLQTFGGTVLAPATLVSTYVNRRVFGGFPVKMYAWRATYNGRVYSGRNSGPMMIVHMRTKAPKVPS